LSDSSVSVPNDRLLLTAEETAQLLNIPRREVYKLANLEPGERGAFPVGVVIHLGPRRVRFSKQALLSWLGATANPS
jgi:predicted DNA-binding transcriptional regulator AlpA